MELAEVAEDVDALLAEAEETAAGVLATIAGSSAAKCVGRSAIDSQQ